MWDWGVAGGCEAWVPCWSFTWGRRTTSTAKGRCWPSRSGDNALGSRQGPSGASASPCVSPQWPDSSIRSSTTRLEPSRRKLTSGRQHSCLLPPPLFCSPVSLWPCGHSQPLAHPTPTRRRSQCRFINLLVVIVLAGLHVVLVWLEPRNNPSSQPLPEGSQD